MTKDVQFKLRLPAAMKDELERAAKKANRSISAEIVNRLDYPFGAPPTEEEVRAVVERKSSPEEVLFTKYVAAQMQAKTLMRMLADMEEDIGNLTGLRMTHIDIGED